jgi:hypothetical protein
MLGLLANTLHGPPKSFTTLRGLGRTRRPLRPLLAEGKVAPQDVRTPLGE